MSNPATRPFLTLMSYTGGNMPLTMEWYTKFFQQGLSAMVWEVAGEPATMRYERKEYTLPPSYEQMLEITRAFLKKEGLTDYTIESVEKHRDADNENVLLRCGSQITLLGDISGDAQREYGGSRWGTDAQCRVDALALALCSLAWDRARRNAKVA